MPEWLYFYHQADKTRLSNGISLKFEYIYIVRKVCCMTHPKAELLSSCPVRDPVKSKKIYMSWMVDKVQFINCLYSIQDSLREGFFPVLLSISMALGDVVVEFINDKSSEEITWMKLY